MPISDIPETRAFGSFSRHSYVQLGIVHKAAYDLVLVPYKEGLTERNL